MRLKQMVKASTLSMLHEKLFLSTCSCMLIVSWNSFTYHNDCSREVFAILQGRTKRSSHAKLFRTSPSRLMNLISSTLQAVAWGATVAFYNNRQVHCIESETEWHNQVSGKMSYSVTTSMTLRRTCLSPCIVSALVVVYSRNTRASDVDPCHLRHDGSGLRLSNIQWCM